MTDTNDQTALVLLSGGQDSSLCLAYALTRYPRVETVSFDYGQTHRVELECRHAIRDAFKGFSRQWDKRLGEDHLLSLPAIPEIGGTALTDNSDITMMENGLPSTFVPGRNLLFLTYAAALAYRRGLKVLVGGMCETDYSGYPDCRRDTLDKLETAINLGMESKLSIETPLMYLDKAQSWSMTHDIGGDALVDIICEHSHSCYRGNRDKRHAWGYGCNDCPACDLRARGYEVWTST
ncbi:MAG: 7-cyano-7-deazaguanine synthase QueC [Parvibaculales bacterium]